MQWIKCPFAMQLNVQINDIIDLLSPKYDHETIQRAVIEIRYEGYIKRQEKQIEKLYKLNNIQFILQLNMIRCSGYEKKVLISS